MLRTIRYKIAKRYEVGGAVPRFASMVATWRGLFRASVTLTPDFEFASPITFFGWASWSILSPARVAHSLIPQLPCVAVPSSPSGSVNPHLLHNIISWRRHLQKPSQKLRKLLPAPTRRPRCTRGNPPQPGFWVQVIERAQLYNSGLTAVGCAGIAELMVFHPVDTTAKRLMSNIGKVRHYTMIHYERI
jgi:hypothetical protein